MHDLLIGILIGAGCVGAGAVLGYEIGRASRLAKPLLQLPSKKKETARQYGL